MKKLALTVGLNYPGTSAALSGCINDMEDWAGVLADRGYEVRKLPEPTKVELMAELKAIVARARYRDRIVFTYSGHGTWLPDANGDEADGRDEALVCKDYLKGGLLLDDELQQIFGEARFGVRRLIISDSCHSGTVSRFAAMPLFHLDASGAEIADAASRQARFLPPAEFLDPDSTQYQAALQVEGSKAVSVPRAGTMLLSGCADFEVSYDASFEGRPNGAMTYFALKALREGAGTVKQVHAKLRKDLPSSSYPQSPQLTAMPHQRYWSFL